MKPTSQKCYNCGCDLDKTNTTREHIPARNLFNGFPDSYKQNNITVPACHTCNLVYSKSDHEIRDAIGVTNDNDQNAKVITEKAVRSSLRNKRVLYLDDHSRVIAVEFSYKNLRTSAIKDFKGIYYHKYGHPLPSDWKTEIVSDFDGSKKSEAAKEGFAGYLSNDKWSKSGHEDVFRYRMKTCVADEEGNITDTGNPQNALIVVSMLEYHNKIGFIVIAASPQMLSSVKKRYNEKMKFEKKLKNYRSISKKKKSKRRAANKARIRNRMSKRKK